MMPYVDKLDRSVGFSNAGTYIILRKMENETPDYPSDGNKPQP